MFCYGKQCHLALKYEKLGRRPCLIAAGKGGINWPRAYLQARSRLLLAESEIIMRCLRGIIFIFKFKGPRGEAAVIGMEIVEIFHLGKD